MNIESLTFVALDLETTGLNPEQDTIIEVAAIRFRLEKDNNTFRIVTIDERSMLIDPGKELKEEVTMITGISQDMLKGRSTWEEVQERVRTFIGNDMIVGHNVLFDIAMLKTHGIHLDITKTIDTFELSEIFSQEVESLNLGFLAKHYGISTESEHRALDDTRLSMHLFCHYLQEITILTSNQKSIWNHISHKEQGGSLRILQSIFFEEYTIPYQCKIINDQEIEKRSENTAKSDPEISEKYFSYISYSGNFEEEFSVISDGYAQKHPLLVITDGKQQGEFLMQECRNRGVLFAQLFSHDEYLSFPCLKDLLQRDSFSRKEAIFLVKLLFWLEKSEHFLLNELKYYGEERNWIQELRCQEAYENPNILRQKIQASRSGYVLIDINSYLKAKDVIPENMEFTVYIRDIPLFENILRRTYTQKVSFEELHALLSEQENVSEHEFFALEYIQYIYEQVPVRPQGEHPFPPGDHGETYFFTQKELWHRGYETLILSTQILDAYKRKLQKEIEKHTILTQRKIQKCIDQLTILSDIHQYGDTNIGIIITIQQQNTTISIIPRNIAGYMKNWMNHIPGAHIILTGYHIETPSTKRFLEKEGGFPGIKDCTTNPSQFGKMITLDQLQTYQPQKNKKVVILTTSMKHIRLLSQEAKKSKQYDTIITQGISGGKAKMLSTFQHTTNTTLLIGLIDSWIHDPILWTITHEVILGKIPFEPPTDPYYLARTIGMRNNFEEYSLPSTLITINALIGRIRSGGSVSQIYCLDERIHTTVWGMELQKELI